MAFHGDVALVTGAASGMGRLAVERLAPGGARAAALAGREDVQERLWEISVERTGLAAASAAEGAS